MTKSRNLIAKKQFWSDDQIAWLVARRRVRRLKDAAFTDIPPPVRP